MIGVFVVVVLVITLVVLVILAIVLEVLTIVLVCGNKVIVVGTVIDSNGSSSVEVVKFHYEKTYISHNLSFLHSNGKLDIKVSFSRIL